MSGLSWAFKGVDLISGPAKAAVASLRSLKAALTTARRDASTGRFQASWLTTMRRQVHQLRRDLRASAGAMASFGQGAGIVGGAVAYGAVAVGRSVVELAAFQQSAETTLAATMGSSTEAARAFQEAIAIANQTPLDTRDVVTAMNGLASAGFNTLATMRPMLGILTDVGALHGADAMSRFSLALGQVQARGALTMEELNQLREAAPSIARPLQDALARSLNISGPNAGRAVQQAISARRVSAAMFNAALGEAGATMNANTGGNLGGVARAQSQTLIGSLSNVSNAWDNLIMSMGTGQNALANSAGLRQFRAFLDSITSALDVTTPRGQRAMNVLRPLIDGVFGTLFRGSPGTSLIDTVIDGLRDLTPSILSVVKGVRDFVDGFGSGFMGALGPALELIQQLSSDGDQSGTTMRSLGQAVGFLVGAFVLGVGMLATAVSGITMIFTELGPALRLIWNDITEWFSTVPGAMVDGFLASLRERWRGMIEEVRGLASQLPASVRSVLGIHSPSTVFAEIGLNTTRGMTEGITAGQADVTRAVETLVNAPGGSDRPGGARAGLGNVTVNVTIEGRGRSDEELAQDLQDRMETLFADLFERAAMGQG